MPKKYCSFKPVILPGELKKPIDWNKQFDRCAPLDVEIGFGMGEILMRMARESPGRDFVGIEQHWERMYKTLRSMTLARSNDESIFHNIRILKVDAWVVFERLFAPQSVDKVYCLFPCPWPKKGHVKHRLFTAGFLRLLNSRLKMGGGLMVVTDFYPYYEWVLGQIDRTEFDVGTESITPKYGTKFERKWAGEGQKEFFQINLIKKKHAMVPVKEDCILKSYVVDDFNAERFQFNNVTGDITVIFKDMPYL